MAMALDISVMGKLLLIGQDSGNLEAGNFCHLYLTVDWSGLVVSSRFLYCTVPLNEV
jgi:hypothetical protein